MISLYNRNNKNSTLPSFLLYAVGELTIVVLGIFIALQFDKKKIHEEKQELKYSILEEISTQLQDDLTDINGNLKGSINNLYGTKQLVNYLKGEKVFLDSMPYFLHSSFVDYIFITNTSSYETLKINGLHLIENDSLKNKLSYLYDFTYEVVNKVQEKYYPSNFARSYKDFILTKFEPFMRIDSKDNLIFKDVRGQNNLDAIALIQLNQMMFWRNFLITEYTKAKKEIDILQKMIATELESTN